MSLWTRKPSGWPKKCAFVYSKVGFHHHTRKVYLPNNIVSADIIYHLFDAFTAYNAEIVEAKRRDAAPQAVWPCRLKIIACFAKREPIILGVDILDGTLRVGTPLCVVKVDPETQKKEIIDLGKM